MKTAQQAHSFSFLCKGTICTPILAIPSNTGNIFFLNEEKSVADHFISRNRREKNYLDNENHWFHTNDSMNCFVTHMKYMNNALFFSTNVDCFPTFERKMIVSTRRMNF